MPLLTLRRDVLDHRYEGASLPYVTCGVRWATMRDLRTQVSTIATLTLGVLAKRNASLRGPLFAPSGPSRLLTAMCASDP